AGAGYVVSGCAAALMVGAAAIMSGDDPARMARLPDTTGMKSRWVSRRFGRRSAAGQAFAHYGYAQAVRGAGGHFVEVGDDRGVTLEQVAGALEPETAGVYWVAAEEPGLPSPEQVIELAHSRGV